MRPFDVLAQEAIAEHPELERLLRAAAPKQAAYRFWSSGRGDRYFWTTEKIGHLGGRRYVAGVYRFLKTKKQWKLVRKVGFAKRFKAKDWARREYNADAERAAVRIMSEAKTK